MSTQEKTGLIRGLVLAPVGRDAKVAATLLSEVGVSAVECASLDDLASRLSDEIWLAVLTEEAVGSADAKPVHNWISQQPSWSDLPVLLITDRPVGLERNPVAERLSQTFGNVTFLERPFHPSTFASVVRSAVRGRQRQYEAKARLEELDDTANKLRMALTAGRLGSWQIELATSTFVASEETKAHFGRAPSDAFTYDDLLASVDPDDRALLASAIRAARATGERLKVEVRTVWPDGARHWIEVSATHVPGPAGSPGRLVGVSTDISDRKQGERRLQDLNETLERRVAERTADLVRAHELMVSESAERERAQKQLRQAQKMEIIGQLTGGVAHDFNNLLMAVLVNLDTLAERVSHDPSLKRMIDTAIQGARRGAELTQRLLAFARQQDLNVRPVDLTVLVEGMSELLKRSVGPQTVLNIEVPTEPTFALVDANQIELALLNLAVNARDAMPDGGYLTIQLESGDGSALESGACDQFVALTVRDTGCGMDAETLEHAVEPYFSTKEPGQGTGLGLSMVDGLVKQLNGELSLTSEPGVGTTAILMLPKAPPGHDVGVPEPVVPQPCEQQQPCTVLFVDDDFLVAMSSVDMLEDLGHQVIQVESGAKALEVLKTSEDIDLLITDHAMPGMSGLQLAEAASAIRPGLPIVLATGYAELPEGDSRELPRLTKPYRKEDLATTIARLIPSVAEQTTRSECM